MGGALLYAAHGSINYYFLNIIESLFVCAVDLFILITGYYMVNTQRRSIIKPIKLICQVIVFKLGIYVLMVILGKTALSIKGLFGALLPDNYFVILYVALYFVSPYINIVMKSFSNHQRKKMMITVFLIFSVYAIIVDLLSDLKGETIIGLSSIGMFGSQGGYTIVNFALMYMIGAYIRMCEDDISKIGRGRIVLYLVVLVLLDAIWYLTFDYFQISDSTSHSYHNPIIVLLAVVSFILFKKIDLGQNKIINMLAKGSFTVFLLHSHFLPYIRIEYYVNKSLPKLALHIIISIVVIYLVCWVLFFVYERITAPIFKIIEKKHPKMTYTID